MHSRIWISSLPALARGGLQATSRGRAAVVAMSLLVAFAGDALALDGVWGGPAIAGTIPPPRAGNSLTEAWSQVVLLFGGTTSSGQLLDDTWVLYVQPGCPGNPSYWTQIPKAGAWPPARKGHVAVYDTEHSELVIFGGQGAQGPLNDAWAFSINTLTWHQISAGNPPCGRRDAVGVYDPNNHRFVVFGGTDNSSVFRDTWVLNLQSPAWSVLFPGGPQCDVDCFRCGTYPSARTNATAVYYPANSSMIVHGGTANNSYLGDTWSLALGSTPAWTQLTVSGPTYQRSGHVAAFDGTRIYYQGGRKSATEITADAVIMYPVSGNAWQRETVVINSYVPPACEDHAATWSTKHEGLFVLNTLDSPPVGYGNLFTLFPADPTPPATITDFNLEFVTCDLCPGPFLRTSAQACWTSVGDDGLQGVPCYYNMRWNPFGPVTDMTWSGSIDAGPVTLASGPAGQQVCETAFGCNWGIFGYPQAWIGVRAYDERGNWSSVSNNVFLTHVCPDGSKPDEGTVSVTRDADLRVKVSGVRGTDKAQLTLAVPLSMTGESVAIDVLDVAGRRVRTLLHGAANSGVQNIDWDLRNDAGATVGSGIYFAHMRLGSITKTARIAVVR